MRKRTVGKHGNPARARAKDGNETAARRFRLIVIDYLRFGSRTPRPNQSARRVNYYRRAIFREYTELFRGVVSINNRKRSTRSGRVKFDRNSGHEHDRIFR